MGIVGRQAGNDGRTRVGRLTRDGVWGTVALDVKEGKAGVKRVPVDPLEASKFEINDVLVFEYNDAGYAVGLRKPTKKDPLPSSWKTRMIS